MIKEFLRWWYTDSEGREYMTFLHCAQDDIPLVVITTLLNVFIVGLYLQVAYQSRKQYARFGTSEAKAYLKAKLNVFIFCALSGYGYTVISVFVNPYKLRILLLLILAVWTIKFIKRIKLTNSITRILEGEELLKQKIKQLQQTEHDVLTRFHKINSSKEVLDVISYKDLEASELDKWYEVDEFIRFKLISKTEEELTFVTEMKDGAVFGNHYHNCEEICYVHEGILNCPSRGLMIKENQRITFSPYEKHRPEAIGFTYLTVVFKKNKNG